MMTSLFALILAGGSGERFWPLSRRARPKQLLRLVSDKTLLEETIARLEGLVPRERILVLTNVDQEKAVRELLPDLPEENIVAEPAKRDTAAAVALATTWVTIRDHQATMLVLPADHVISNRAAFQETMRSAARAAEATGALVTIGIKPTSSIRLSRRSIDKQGNPVTVETNGRHDPCVGIRATPIAEAMLALVLMDHALLHRAQNADVRTPTPRIAGSLQGTSKAQRTPITKVNPEPHEA